MRVLGGTVSRVRHRAWHDVVTYIVTNVGEDLWVIEDFFLAPLTMKVLGAELPINL